MNRVVVVGDAEVTSVIHADHSRTSWPGRARPDAQIADLDPLGDLVLTRGTELRGVPRCRGSC
jgi:hypothetical protein